MKSENNRRSFLTAAVAAAATARVVEGTAIAGAAPAPQEPTRGSEKWVQEHGPMTFSTKDLGDIRALIGTHSAKLLDWCQYGQPAIDGICGTFEVPRLEAVGPLVTDLVRLHPRFRLGIDVFPYGIPVLDRIQVNFRGGLQRAGLK
jgi:hypothetical protein